jgi:hypothetical protein
LIWCVLSNFIAKFDGYTILVPAIGEEGNHRAGVRAPMTAAPLGTCCG